jgi:hypothetical protein
MMRILGRSFAAWETTENAESVRSTIEKKILRFIAAVYCLKLGKVNLTHD